jgi:tetratricopeptide (TPR) repeat protein
MARADRRRNRRPPTAAVAHRSSSASVVEDTLFFTRLRRQARWIFVVLAVIFGGSFVIFGVGSEVPGGIADVLGRSPGGDGIPSVSDAREEVEERPNDPEALRKLSTALQAEGETEEAIQTLERLRTIAPRDETGLRELATLYVTQAATLRQRAQREQARMQQLAPEEPFLPAETTDIGRALGERPISDAITSDANEAFTATLTKLQESYTKAKEIYLAVAELEPEDPTLQLQLADAAVNSGDTAAAIAAYKKFLELAPDDPSAQLVRDEIKRLEESTADASG